jgi:hypothetical protein
LTNLLLTAQERDARNVIARASGGGCDGARVFSFGQNDVLWVCGGALAYAFENHKTVLSFQFSVFSVAGCSRVYAKQQWIGNVRSTRRST